MDERVLLGKRIREVRRAHGFSQEQLAERIDINAKYLGFIEQGRANPTLEVLVALAKALKVDLVDLFNYAWLKMSETELRRKIRAVADDADLTRLRELLAMIKARDL